MSTTRQPILSLAVLLAWTWALVCPVPTTALTSENPDTLWRWIGLKKDSAIHDPCPNPKPPWTVRQLFDGPFVADSQEAFCLYELESHCLAQGNVLGCSCELDGDCMVEPVDQNALLNTVGPKLKQIDPDLMTLAFAATDLQEGIQPSIHRFFLDQAGSSGRPPTPMPSPPRLALIDSKASAGANPNDLPSRSPHGESLLAMAKDLLCDDLGLSCSVDITTRLALPYVLTVSPGGGTLVSRDDVRGGHVGTVGELAEAIHGEVRDWLLAGSSSGVPDRPLILNLSLAWHPDASGDLDASGNGHTAVMAVFSALQDAGCKGALAITAAGNRSDGPDPAPSIGPLLPAAWERLAAPDLAACQQLGSATPDTGIFPTNAEDAYRPLIHAVSGIASSGQPLVNARNKSTPPRVAFGGPAIASGSTTRHPLAILTGSSVATLIVSVSAAAVWADRIDIPSYRVMKEVDLAGEQPGLQARKPDLCQLTKDGEQCSSKRSEVRRVSLCSSLGSAYCPPWRERYPDLSELQLDAFHAESKRYSKETFLLQGAEPVCQTESYYAQEVSSSPSCPQLQLAGIQRFPWVFPQPQSIPCPPCHMLGEDSLQQSPALTKGSNKPTVIHIELDDSFRDLQLGAATLTLCPRSPHSEVYSLDEWPNPQPGDKVVIVGLEQPSCLEATLSFSITDSTGHIGSISSPITVIP